MKRISLKLFICALPLTVVAGFACDTFAGEKPVLKSRKTTVGAIRGQSPKAPGKTSDSADDDVFDQDLERKTASQGETKSTSSRPGATGSIGNDSDAAKGGSTKTVAATDEQVFDGDLTPATSEKGTAPCVSPLPPNCTDVNGNFSFPPLTPSYAGLGGPDAGPAGNSMTPQDSQNTPFPSVAANTQSMPMGNRFAAPFLGDFFGSSVNSNASTNPIVAQVTRNNTGSNFIELAFPPVGTNPGTFQTGNSDQLGVLHKNGTFVFTNPSNPLAPASGLTLVNLGQKSVTFNSGPSLGTVQQDVFNVVAHSTTGALDPALTTGRTKLAEGSSPIPRDRVFINYSMFNDTQLITTGGIQVNRYTPGFEKTFFNGNASIEVRAPFASTLTSNVDLTSGISNPTDLQFGNMTLYSKALLYQDRTFAFSSGVGVTLPTASNISVYSGGHETLHVNNDAVHLLPFVGTVWTPNDRFYTQGLAQVDVDMNGNKVQANQSLTTGLFNAGGVLTQAGTYRDAPYLYLSASAGYWVYRSQTPGRWGVTGFSPVTELHYNRNLQEGNVIQSTSTNGVATTVSTLYGTPFSVNEVLNGVIGANTIFGNNRILTMGYTTPLGMGHDRQFASEFRVMFNWYFGGGNSSPLTRVGRTQF